MQLDLFSPTTRILQPPALPAPEARTTPKADRSDPVQSSVPSPGPSQAARKIPDPVALAPAKAQRIVDTGERLERARKDYYRQALCVADLSEMSGAQKTELVTKDAVWPTPDYAQWIALGMPAPAAALVKILRDSLPVKPRLLRERSFDYLAERYVSIVGEVRDACASARSTQEVVDACAAIQRTHRGHGVEVVYKARYSPLNLTSSDRARASRLIDEGFPGDREGWKRGYAVRRDGIGYSLYKQRRRIAEGFPSEAAAWSGLRESLAAARAQKKAESSKIPSYPHLEVLERIGPARRTGITADDFITTFGFRGVQFGNWLPDAERQAVLDHAYAGLLDLTDLIGISPALLALGGRRSTSKIARLGIAFGARGRGGRTAAHYEPGEVVLNMTKFTGAGRVAHECWHGFDHWLAIVGHPNEIEAGAARFASGHNIHSLDRFAALPDLSRPLVEALTELLRACTKTTPRYEDALARARHQVQQAEQQIAMHRLLIAEADAMPKGGARQRRFAEDALGTWHACLESAGERLRTLEAGTMPASLIDSQRSHYRKQAEILDPQTKPYWSTPCELTARGFEAWCHDKLAEQGRVSQYLVHSVEEGRFAPPLYRADIYPVGGERRRINTAFDDLMPLIAAQIAERASA